MKSRLSVFLALTVAIIWGVSFVATKIVVASIPPTSAAFMRFVIAFVILIGVSSLKKRNALMRGKDRFYIMMMGLTGVTLYFLAENYGLKFTSAANGSLIVSTVPVFTVIFNALFLRERFPAITVIGIIMSFIGIYVLLFGFSPYLSINWKGDIVMFISVLSWLGYTFYAKKLGNRYNSMQITTELTFWGAVFFIPFVIYDIFRDPMFITAFTVKSLLALLYLGIICSALAYVMWNKALQDEDSHLVNSFIYLIPLFSIITESFYLRQMPPLRVFIAALTIIAGLFITHISSRLPKRKSPRF